MQNTQAQMMHFPPQGMTAFPSDYYDYYNDKNGYKMKEQASAQQRSQQQQQQQEQEQQQPPQIQSEQHQAPSISKQYEQEPQQQQKYPNTILPTTEYQQQTINPIQYPSRSPPAAPPPPPAIEMIPITQMPPVMFAPTMQSQGVSYGLPQSQQSQQQQQQQQQQQPYEYQTANDNINMNPLLFPQKNKYPQSANGVSFPATVSCPYCKSIITTEITEEIGKGAWFWCVVSTFFAPPFCFIPFCISNCKNKTHHCPNCKADLGHYEYVVF